MNVKQVSHKGPWPQTRARFTTSVSALALLAVGAISPALAQTEDDIGLHSLEEILVTGQRASVVSAQAIKRDSEQFVDSIVSTDIGKLPDTNVAETLQRIS